MIPQNNPVPLVPLPPPRLKTTLNYKIKYKPRFHQFEIHRSRAKTKLLVCHRRLGKTKCGVQEMVKVLVGCKRDFPIGVYIAPTREQAKRVAWAELKRSLRGMPGYKPNESELSIEFLDCKIYVMGARNYENIRGMYLDFAFIDEFDDIDIDAWESVILPALAERDGHAFISGTPKGRGNLYNMIEQMKDRADPAEQFWIMKASETGVLSEKVMKRMRQTMTAAKWMREMECSFDDAEGALWNREDIIYKRTKPEFVRIVIAIDPAVTYGEKSDETGIVIAGMTKGGEFFVIDDLSGRYKPGVWAAMVVKAYVEHEADAIIAEGNQGGDLIRSLVQQAMKDNGVSNIKYKKIHARRGKALRAEPVAALYENQKVFHLKQFATLENQLCTWQPTKDTVSPDRLDALVYALTELAKINYDGNRMKGKGWKGDSRPGTNPNQQSAQGIATWQTANEIRLSVTQLARLGITKLSIRPYIARSVVLPPYKIKLVSAPPKWNSCHN